MHPTSTTTPAHHGPQTPEARRAALRTTYLRALAHAAAAWRMDCMMEEAVVRTEEAPGGGFAVRVWGPSFTTRPNGVGATLDAALADFFEACRLPPSGWVRSVEHAVRTTGAWVPMPGEEIDREGAVAITLAPLGRVGWVVTDATGRSSDGDRRTVRAKADHLFRERAGREPRERPEHVPADALYLALEGA
jgi:hypothetical protein